MRTVDPNLLVRDDAVRVTAAEAFVENGAWVSHLVLVETLWVLDAVHVRSAAQLAKAIELLLNHNSLTLHSRAWASLNLYYAILISLISLAGECNDASSNRSYS